MSVREAVRLVLIWSVVVVFFAATSWSVVETGEFTGLVGFSGFPVVGALILTSRRGNGIGRFLLAYGGVWIVSAPLNAPSIVGAGPSWLEVVNVAVAWVGWGLLPMIGLLFPTGKIETRRGRVVAAVLLGYVSLASLATLVSTAPTEFTGRRNPLALPALEPLVSLVLGPAGIVLFILAISATIVDLGIRWRRSDPTERLQYRWLVFGLAATVSLALISALLNQLWPEESWVSWVSGILTAAVNLIPLSIWIAVTRHGLYEIGRVVSRTVSYAIVTLLVVGLYALIVVSVTRLLPGLPSLGVALATLAAAAVFLPVLRVVQRGIDRRFDRERYDAARVVDAFGDHLRTDVNPNSTAGELLEAVERTLQPASVGLWTPERSQ